MVVVVDSLQLANGLRTRLVDTGGRGATVVLVHGLANSLEIWNRVMPALATRFRVIAFDLPGFGKADRPNAAYDGGFFAEQLEALFDAYEIGRAHLVGSSLGASIIVRFAADHLRRVDRVVLAAPGGFGRKTHPLMRLPALPLVGSWLGRPTSSNNALTIRLAMHDRRHVTPDLLALTNRYAQRPGSELSFVRTLQAGVGLLGAKGRRTVAAHAAQLDRPALVVWGKQDRVFPVRYAQRVAALLPQARVHLIDRCGHYPHWEQPEAFATAVEDFLT